MAYKRTRQRQPEKAFPINALLFIIISSLLIGFILEALSRRSLPDAYAFMVGKPYVFLFNCLIVCVTISFAFLFKKRVFFIILISTIWLAFGIANCVLLGFRTASPITAVDLLLAFEGIKIMHVYFEIWQIILIFALGSGAVAGLVYIAVKSRRYTLNLMRALLRSSLICVIFLVYAIVLFSRPNLISTVLRPSLYDSYLNYGFAYCFCYSFVDVGIREPEGYSIEGMKEITEELDIDIDENAATPASAKRAEAFLRGDGFSGTFEEFVRQISGSASYRKPEGYTVETVEKIREQLVKNTAFENTFRPNIIFVQLESFFDPGEIEGLSLSKDPIPNFHALQTSGTTGRLYVPVVAGGTVNTEFEVLTGMSLDFFGVGEFPYYSVLKENACESLAFDLRALDYTATAIHNYSGTFYYRDEIYANLGFDRFVSREYMYGYDVTPMGWPKDDILLPSIMDALKTTQGRDFIFAVTVQTHGKYIPMPEDMTGPVQVTSGIEDANEKSVMEYFLCQLYETDAFIGKLIDRLKTIDEDTLVVFYGDHLPGLNLREDAMESGSLYSTQYVLWSNFDMEKRDGDLESYQLSARALSLINMDVGVMIRYHQNAMDDANYKSNLEMLEYDMLYGERFIYSGAELIDSARLKMGIHPIRITGAEMRFDNLFVYGENMTSDSRVYRNGKACDDTIYVNDTLLIVPGELPEEGDLLAVAQISDDAKQLGISEDFVYKK